MLLGRSNDSAGFWGYAPFAIPDVNLHDVARDGLWEAVVVSICGRMLAFLVCATDAEIPFISEISYEIGGRCISFCLGEWASGKSILSVVCSLLSERDISACNCLHSGFE